jgi:cephalosporin-C deacetylase-like acetyl esterase
MSRRVLGLVFLAACLGCAPALGQSGGDLNFLRGLDDFRDVRRMLPDWLLARAEEHLARRKTAIDDIRDLDGLASRQKYVRQRMIETLGGFPERTPLNPRVVGALERDGYRIEKIVFESQPNFFVTANLYLPTGGRAPYPAVLYPLGHEEGGKAYPVWQQMLATLARKGYVALAWDPLGQGERMQHYDPDWQDSKFHASTMEHTELGIQCLLTGEHIAKYTIWDGLRALDYLLSRKEVDASRVAVTGNSGGGTHTTYIAALDDRITVAAPSCYTSSWSRMLRTLGPQDSEQVFPYWLKNGLDYPDFIYAFGPKPFLALSAIRDFFPIMGARETFAELATVYSRLGLRDRIAMVEADDGHGFSAPRRAAAYEWFGRWLKAAPDQEPETEIRPELASDLECTPTGQVSTSLKGEDVFTLNRKRAAALASGRPAGSAISAVEKLQKARLRSGFAPVTTPLVSSSYGTVARQGYRIEKVVYASEPGIIVPALLYIPEGGSARKPAMLVVDGAGKSASAKSQERFVRAGMVVLSVDVRGLGETRATLEGARTDFQRFFGDYDSGMTAMLIGKTLPGMRAEDIARGLDLLAARPEVDAARISAYAKDAGAVPLLYAAAFDSRVRAVVLEGMLVSYDAVVNQRIHRQVFEQIVPGALADFDLPDLVADLAPRPTWLINVTDPLGNRMRTADVRHVHKGAWLRVRESHPDEALAGIAEELTK